MSGVLTIAGSGVLVIAEAGVNHNGDEVLAHRLIDSAVLAGADIVKFQTFRTENLAVTDAPKAEYQLGTTDGGQSQFAMLKALELPADAYSRLMNHCGRAGIEFASTPFDEESADALAALGMRRFKLSSGEVTNLPLLAHVARFGRPVILSTGMSDLEEVAAAVACLREAGCADLTLLHCLTDYPAPLAETNLRAIVTLREAFGVPVGYSDHTEGLTVSLAAVALGATVIEKHFTLDRALPGPDHKASLEPEELAALVAGCRDVAAALGDGRKVCAPSEEKNRTIVRRSLTTVRDIPLGAVIERDMLMARRPATGLPPGSLDLVVGRRAARPIPAGTVLTGDMLA
ncbi:MAG: N-acetylneuraminate synthase [Alphaproteobacteria bacterium]